MKIVITIGTLDEMNFQAKTVYNPNKTASILINLAMSFVRMDEKNRQLSISDIISPYDGNPVVRKAANA